MRVRVRLNVAKNGSLSFDALHAPGRAMAYAAVGSKLGADRKAELHEGGEALYHLRPFGFGPPTFPIAKRVKGRWAVGGDGFWEIGSPHHDLVWAFATWLKEQRTITWAGVSMDVVGIEAPTVPEYPEGFGSFTTVSPTVVKDAATAGSAARREARDEGDPRRYLNPYRDGHGRDDGTVDERAVRAERVAFEDGLNRNARKKTETLGLESDLRLSVIEVISSHTRRIGDGVRVGARIVVDAVGAPEALVMLWAWGLGESNSAGFGWIGVNR